MSVLYLSVLDCLSVDAKGRVSMTFDLGTQEESS